MRTKSVLRLHYVTLKHEITKKEIDSHIFRPSPYCRRINEGEVRSILKGLENFQHFDSAFVVCKTKTGYEIIDGHHRYRAIELYLARNQTHKVEVLLIVYPDVDEATKKALYTLHNSGRKQSTNDFIMQYKDDIGIYKLVGSTSRFPVPITVYGGSGSISFYNLVGAYLASKTNIFNGGFTAKPQKFIECSQELNKGDVAIMASFVRDFVSAFGPIRNNKWIKTTPFFALFRIWADNRETMNPDVMVRLFQKKLLPDYEAHDLISNSGAKACVYARNKFVDILNQGRNKQLFIKKEIIEEQPIAVEEEE